MKIKYIIMIALVAAAALVFAYKLDVFKRVGVVVYSHWIANYQPAYARDPLIKDPTAKVRVFTSDRSYNDIKGRYEHLFGFEFTEKTVVSPSIEKISGREYIVKRFAVAVRPYSYLSIGEVQWMEGGKNSASGSLIISGDDFNPKQAGGKP